MKRLTFNVSLFLFKNVLQIETKKNKVFVSVIYNFTLV